MTEPPRAAPRYVLPGDVSLVEAERLPSALRQRVGAGPGSMVLVRPLGRSPAKLVSAELAPLLARFREPNTVVSVLADACRGGMAVDDALARLVPPLEELIRQGMLVPEDSAERTGVRPRLMPGDRLGRYEIQETITATVDCDVYLACADTGERFALKLQHGGGEAGRLRLRREAELLAHLSGLGAPRHIAWIDAAVGSVSISSWVEGRRLGEALPPGRSGRDGYPLREVLALAAEVACRYEELHARGVLHGDVHPNNVLVDPRGSALLVDFEWGSGPGHHASPARGGNPCYFEPELATALLEGRALPPATVLGENHAVGALVYMILTGATLVRGGERDAVLRSIVDTPAPPLPAPFPAPLRRALAALLEKSPSCRPPDLTALIEALREALASPPRTNSGMSRASPERALDALAHRDPASVPDDSLMRGRAGVAYALFRAACWADRPDWLAAADRWVNPLLPPGHPSAVDPVDGVRQGLLEGELGAQLVRALVADSLGDGEGAARAVSAVFAWLDHERPLELQRGLAGGLVALAFLRDLGVARTQVESKGNALARLLAAAAVALPPLSSCAALPRLGMAHGWAGLVFAALRWGDDSSVWNARLQELKGLTRASGTQGASWPVAAHGQGDDRHVAWWCNGSAGHAQLWALAYERTRDPALLEVATAAAEHLWGEQRGVADLCCGFAGRAHALLAVYRSTDDPIWLSRAERLAERAEEAASAEGGDGAQALFKGALGVALLQLELTRPRSARMPLMEAW